MLQLVLIGIGAGAATALLFASVASGALISVLLFYLAPLPILIAALGWSHWAGLIAALTASAGLAGAFGPFFFIAFLLGIGLPAWWLGYLALLARTAERPTPDGLEWYPTGHLVIWAALLAGMIVSAAIVNFGLDQESFRASLRGALERILQIEKRPKAQLADAKRLVEFLVAALPPAAAVLTTLTQVVNLWLAGRIVNVSGRLTRPQTDLATIQFPPQAPLLVGFAVAGSFIPGLVGTIASVFAASLMMAYALLGFAVLHFVTRGLSGRAFILTGAYFSVVVLGWPVLMMTLLGLADTAFNFRGRVANRGGPPSTTT